MICSLSVPLDKISFDLPDENNDPESLLRLSRVYLGTVTTSLSVVAVYNKLDRKLIRLRLIKLILSIEPVGFSVFVQQCAHVSIITRLTGCWHEDVKFEQRRSEFFQLICLRGIN